MSVPVVAGGGGPAKAAAPVRSRNRKLTFDRVSFIAVFLGLPLIIFLLFVIWPVLQAIYYSLTNWGGFTNTFKLVGLDNYEKLWHDDIFRRAVFNNIELGIVVPLGHHHPGAVAGQPGHRGRIEPRKCPRHQRRQFLPDHLVLSRTAFRPSSSG